MFMTKSTPGKASGTSSSCVLACADRYCAPLDIECQGPVTEELVWRSCVIAVYHLAGASRNQMILFTPLSFGAGELATSHTPFKQELMLVLHTAHLHHGYETFVRFGRTSKAFKIALINMSTASTPASSTTIPLIRTQVFQFAYTTLFGFHCAFLFIRTGSVLVPIVAHIFCNIMGVPQLVQELQCYPHKATRKHLAAFPYLGLTVGLEIKAMYIIGILVYIYTMRHWTLHPGNVFWTTVDR
jgi:prenyl protein peptidase